MAPEATPPGVGVDVLIVEDSAIQATLLRRTLVQHGFAVTVAKDGAEGLALIRQHKPTLVISDIEMPKMDGYEMCRAIKQDETLQDIPVILLTALADPEDIILGLNAGADNYLTKPYDEQYLLRRIDYVLTNKRLREISRVRVGIEIHFAGKSHIVDSDRQQILDLLLSTFENSVQQNRELTQYLRQVVRLTDAAAAIEAGAFDSASLDDIASHESALGRLARVFQHMAREVSTREQRLRQEVQALRIEIDQTRKARQVAEVTESDYFRRLQQEAQTLRARRRAE
jgi:DNA-binding response OmpR family regulator